MFTFQLDNTKRQHPIAVMGVLDTFGPTHRHTKLKWKFHHFANISFNIAKLCWQWLKYLQKDKKPEGNKTVST